MSKRRDHGDGGIDPRGENSWRLRYRIKGRRISQTFHGSLSDARKELRRLLKSGDDGTHVAPDKITLGQWVEQWIAAGAPGRRQKRVRRGTVERYAELLRGHVVPTLGKRPLQQVQPTEIDALYQSLEGKIAPSTAHHVHTIFGSCLNTAVRKGLLAATPMARVEKIPSPGESSHGMALDGDQLRTLVEGFKDSALYPIVTLAELRTPNAVTMEFVRKAHRLGFPNLRFHDLRGTHETLLLDAGVPVHVVAARCGHDPAVLLRSYAKRTKKADTSAAAVIGALAKCVLGENTR